MIIGYDTLNESISKTIILISDIETASKEQQTGIVQINDAINSLDRQTQENANIANQTYNVAVETDKIAKDIVTDANKKQFIGKESVKAKKTSLNTIENKIDKEEKTVKSLVTPMQKPKKIIPLKETSDEDEWASF